MALAGPAAIAGSATVSGAADTDAERFRSLFALPGVGILEGTIDGVITEANPAICSLLGFEREELLGSPNLQLSHPADLEQTRTAMQQLAVGVPSVSLQKRFIRKDGSLLWGLVTASLVRDEVGVPRKFLAVVQDIGGAKQVEGALREISQRLEALLEASPMAVVVLDHAARVLGWNGAAERIFGWRAAEVLGRPLPTVPETDQATLTGMVEAVMRGESVNGIEVRRLRADGTLFDAAIWSNPLRNERGEPVAVITMVADITEQKRAQDALLESRRRLQHLADAMPQIVWSADASGCLDYFNQRFFAVTGLPRSDEEEQPWCDALHPDDVAPTLQAWEKAVESGTPFEMENRVWDAAAAAYRWHLVRAVPVKDEAGQVQRWFGTATAIHERKRAAEQLTRAVASAEKRSQQLRALAEAAVQIASASGLQSKLAIITEQARQIVGSHQALTSVTSGEGRAEPINAVSLSPEWASSNDHVPLPAGEPVRALVDGRDSPIRLTRAELAAAPALLGNASEKDPPKAPMHGWLAMPLRDRRGRRLGVLQLADKFDGEFTEADEAVLVQIAHFAAEEIERTQDAEALSQSESRFRAIFENNSLALWEEDWSGVRKRVAELASGGVADVGRHMEADPEWAIEVLRQVRVVDTNEAAIRLHEATSRAELLQNLGHLLPRESLEAKAQVLAKLVAGQQRVQVEQDRLTLCGSRRRVILDVVVLPEARDRWDRMLVSAVDITDIRTAEHQIRDLNATLEKRVQQRTALVRRQADQLRELALELTQAEQRERRRVAVTLHDHVQQMLAAAKMRLDTMRTQVGPAQAGALAAVDHLLTESIGASRTLAVELSPPVLYDRGLAAGLAWLARHFGETQGLTVHLDATGDADPEQDELKSFLFQATRELLFNVVKHAGTSEAWISLRQDEKGQVEVVVRDRGHGCDEAVVESQMTRSEGFGIFNIRQRLDLLGGTFEIDTAPGEGCRVTLVAPRHERESGPMSLKQAKHQLEASNPQTPAPERTAEGRVIRVLLADDHRILREGLAGLLEQELDLELVGEAEDGQQAVDLARELRPDVVIMDVTMPRMTGVEATRLITRDLPGVQVIGLSMHEKEDMARAMAEAGAVAYLTKGGPSEQLVEAIRQTQRV